MKTLILLLWLPCIFGSAAAQELAQVSFSGGSTLSHISLIVDRVVLIRLSDDGRILEWGTEEAALRNSQFYAPRLQPYPGRVEYYGPEADSISRGKVKSIGTAFITYYEKFENPFRVGKIRSIGNLQFDYYTNFDNQALTGKTRSIGNLQLNYYSSFENPAFTGKLKSIGSTGITYYSSFDDRLIRGKVKSIGSQEYVWYTSVDRVGFGGSLKSGPFRQNIGSVTYIVQ